MKPWKYLMIIAGLIGLAGFFLPLVEVRHGPIVMGFSAKELSFGMSRTHALLDQEIPKFAERRLPADLRSGREDARLVADASRGAALAFVPAVLMALLGAIGYAKKRFGRFLGLCAFVCGLASIGAWIGLRFAIRYALEEIALKRTTVDLQLGAHALLAIGGLGLLAGIGALVQPDPKV
ncbi:MAG: hypothetical protein ABI867_34595 [Kofleriaceae bacterium]